MPTEPTITTVKHYRGLRRTDWVLLAVLLFCSAVVIVGVVAKAGLTVRPENYNVYDSWQFALGFPCVLVGAYVAFRAPRHPLGWLSIAAGSGVWFTALTSSVFDRNWVHSELIGRPLLFLGFSGWVWCRGILLVLVPLAYPGGRLFRGAPRWRKVVSAAAVLVVAFAGVCNGLPIAAVNVADGTLPSWTRQFQYWLEPVMKALFVCALFAVVDMLVRIVRLQGGERRRHVVVGAAGVILLTPALISVAEIVGYGPGLDSAWAEFVPLGLLPVALAYGVLRHGVLGFHTVVRRASVYAGVMVVSAALYIAVVSVFAALLQHGSGAGSLVATGLVAVSLQPVHAAVQKGLDRWVFGDRDEPYRALAGLGRRLGDSADDPLAVLANVVRSSLKLASVAIEWETEAGERVVAAVATSSRPPGDVRRVPILFEGRQIADLVAGSAEGEREPSPAEQRLLLDLAAAAGAVVQSSLYADDLARSRGNLVRAREEERRRLRHDLHDGLGPTLASVAMGLDAAATRLNDDSELAQLLRDLDHALQDAIADIRRLVAGLRPPALDDLGLVPALREQAFDLANRSQRADGAALSIHVAADPELPAMPAAVEVAAFRIAVEGMTNVLRHAHATSCTVRLAPAAGPDGGPEGAALEVVVEDDGRGIGDAATAGIGFESMRNRAEELGGRLRIGHRVGGGTVLAALLPLHDGRREWATA